jgi:hypothetical protein
MAEDEITSALSAWEYPERLPDGHVIQPKVLVAENHQQPSGSRTYLSTFALSQKPVIP